MMIRTLFVVSAALLLFAFTTVSAEERMLAGSQRGSDLIAAGAADALTSPARVFTEIGEETKNYGAFGVVGGAVRGPIKAGGQALRGGLKMSIGIIDALLSPFQEDVPE